MENRTESQQEEKELLDKDCFMECMRSIVKKMNQQEQMIKLLVDDLNMRNHEGTLYLRGERIYDTNELINILRICKRTLYRYRSIGDLPFIMLHNKAYYQESDIIRLIHLHSDKVDKKSAEEFLQKVTKTPIPSV